MSKDKTVDPADVRMKLSPDDLHYLALDTATAIAVRDFLDIMRSLVGQIANVEMAVQDLRRDMPVPGRQAERESLAQLSADIRAMHTTLKKLVPKTVSVPKKKTPRKKKRKFGFPFGARRA